MKKRLLLSVLMLASLFPLKSAGENFRYTYERRTLNYSIVSEAEKTCVVATKNYAYDQTLIPSVALKGDVEYKVVGIADSAFYSCRELTSISIPEGVKTIGKGAFFSCKKLETISIPTSVDSIAPIAFSENYGLKKANFTSLESLCSISFAGESSNPLSYAGVLTIGGEETTEIVFPLTLTKVKPFTFAGAKYITSIRLHDGITSIGSNAFNLCDALTSLEVPESVTVFEPGAFRKARGLKEFVIPSKIERIEEATFSECTSLLSISIPESVTRIDDSAFSNCWSLKTVNVPKSVKLMGKRVFYDCKNLESVVLPEGLDSISYGMLEACINLLSVNIPTSVRLIGDYAFSSCHALPSVVIPEGVRKIGERAFWANSKLAEIIIPEGVEYVGPLAFSGCLEAKNLSLPSTLTFIGSSSFSSCDALTSVYNYSRVPVVINDGWQADMTFSYYAYNQATLYVPDGTIDAYKEVVPWSLFHQIKAIPGTTGVDSVISDSDTPINYSEPFEVFEINGAKVGDSISSLLPGVYVVRQGNKAKKIAVK